MQLRALIESFLKRLRKKPPSRRPSDPPAYPLGLSKEQAEQVHQISSTPAYKHYTAALQQACESEFRRFLSGLPHDEYLTSCGRIQMLLDVLALPETIDQKVREIDEHSRSTRPVEPDLPLNLAGTAWWAARNGSGNGSGR